MPAAQRTPQDHDLRDRFRGCLLGLAAGDAVGTTVEFRPPGTFQPVTDMVGGGPFQLKAGQWTDDTSMALCLASSLLECSGFDPRDVMDRWCRWLKEGYWSSTGRCFDIGVTTATALRHYRSSGDPFSGSTDSQSAGNGCIMRLAPIPMYFFGNPTLAESRAADSSRLTHAAAECIDATRLFARILGRALAGRPKEEVLLGDASSFLGTEKVVAIARGAYRSKPRPKIIGSGYVIHSLEAALWCFDQCDTFESAILLATNLGDDADTTAAVCGQVAGAYRGTSGIPSTWLQKLAMGEEISDLADQLLLKSVARSDIAP